VCDRLLLLQGGQAVAVGRADTVLDESTLESVYGCRVVVDKHPSSRRPTVRIVWPDPEGR
jgi:iron complex transport system ATP-binding protein